jgi:outer membrane protein assembly factor BamB
MTSNARRIGMILLLAPGLGACERVSAGTNGVELVSRAATLDQEESMMSADQGRSGFYPNQPALDPATVGSPYFGQLFDATVDGQIYAQPLYAGGVLFVATETNNLYGLDPATGAALWTRQLGTPFLASDLNCGDLTPSIGVTGTPAIDEDAGTAYLLSKTYANGQSGAAAWYAHAIDLATGAERDGFPVAIAGAASNDAAHVFDPTQQHQRPGLLLMNGVVYAAFGAHCDEWPYAGWVVGVSTRGFVQTLWTTEAGAGNVNGGGIWQAGGGLVSDGDGQLIFATGNDWSSLPGPIAGHTPPGALGESIVRLSAQPDGTLAATDFFSPTERDALNQGDTDLGSGAPMALPASLGTSAHPNLLAEAGKSGYFYLLDRDDLGGYQQGAGGSDHVLQKLGPFGGVWSKPSVWPGDGGYVYVPIVAACTPTDPSGCLLAFKMGAAADGTPMLSRVGTSSSTLAYGTSAVVVTSDGTRSGSALLWTVWSSGWEGTGGELRAYDPVPQDGVLPLRYLADTGTSAKFTAPAVGDGRIYVGTREGHILGFGVTGAPALRAQGAAFVPTLVGDAASSMVQVTVSGAVTVVGLGTSGDFALSADAPEVPFAAAAGTSFTVPITFRPTADGAIVGTLRITTDGGSYAIPLSGVGQSAVPKLSMSPPVLTFPPIVMGSVSIQTVTLTNVSDAPMTLTEILPPASPFSLSGLPSAGAVLASGDSFIASISYAPTTAGTSSGYLSVAAGDVVAAMAVEGSALMGGKLRISPDSIDVGSDYVGNLQTAVFQLVNDGDVAVVIEKSKPPTTTTFQAVSPFDEGTIIAPGASLEQLVRVSPAALGLNTDVWQLNANDGQGLRVLSFSVTGIAWPTPAPTTTTTTTTTTPMTTTDPTTTAPTVTLMSGQGSGGAGSTSAPAGGCSVGGAAPWALAPTFGSPALVLAACGLALVRRRRTAPDRLPVGVRRGSSVGGWIETLLNQVRSSPTTIASASPHAAAAATQKRVSRAILIEQSLRERVAYAGRSRSIRGGSSRPSGLNSRAFVTIRAAPGAFRYPRR